jgi:signal transduction histidine kinase
MLFTQISSDEDERFIDLKTFDILDTASEAEFEELVELAGHITGCAIAIFSLSNHEKNWFKSRNAISSAEILRDTSFYEFANDPGNVTIVEDASIDDRFSNNKLVTGDTNIRFFAGVPVVSTSGHKLGTICVLDQFPSTLQPSQQQALIIISRQLTCLLELRLRSKMIWQRAVQLDDLKNEALLLAIKASETEKGAISDELHENLAQGLATCLLYLSIAKDTEVLRLPYISKTKDFIKELLVDIRSLSNSIIPHKLKSISFEEVLKDYLDKETDLIDFTVNLKVTGNDDKIVGDHALTIFRIIEKQIELLKEKRDVSYLNITIEAGKAVTLTLEEDGPLQSFAMLEKELITSMIYSRTTMLGGSIQSAKSETSQNKITITFPLLPDKNPM